MQKLNEHKKNINDIILSKLEVRHSYKCANCPSSI